MSYSLGFRKKVLSVKSAEGLTIDETVKRFHINRSTVFRWSKRLHARKRPPVFKIDMNALSQDVRHYPDGYLKERAARLGVCTNCVWQGLKRLGVTYNKNSESSQGQPRKTIYLLPEDKGL